MLLFLKYLPDTDSHTGVVYKWTHQGEQSLAAYKQYKSCCNWYEGWQNPWTNKEAFEFSSVFSISSVTSFSKYYCTHGKFSSVCPPVWILWLAGQGGKNHSTSSLSSGIVCLQHWYVEYFSGQTLRRLDYMTY